MLAQQTSDICVFNSPSCVTTLYLVNTWLSKYVNILLCSNTFVRLENIRSLSFNLIDLPDNATSVRNLICHDCMFRYTGDMVLICLILDI